MSEELTYVRCIDCGNVQAVGRMLVEWGLIPAFEGSLAIAQKQAKVLEMMQYAEARGTLQQPTKGTVGE